MQKPWCSCYWLMKSNYYKLNLVILRGIIFLVCVSIVLQCIKCENLYTVFHSNRGTFFRFYVRKDSHLEEFKV